MSAIVLKWFVTLGMAVARMVLSKPTRMRARPIAIITAANLTPVGYSRSSWSLGSATSKGSVLGDRIGAWSSLFPILCAGGGSATPIVVILTSKLILG